MPEDQTAFFAALMPLTASNITLWEAQTVMGEPAPEDAVSDIDRMNWWIEATCRLRLKYAETIINLRSA